MTRKTIQLTRRQVLMGAAGITLALPVLPSLFLKPAYGADPVFVRKPRLYWLTTHHGGAHENSMFPSEALLTQSEQLFSDHAVRSGALRATIEGASRGVSAVLRADASRFTEQILSRINVLRGIDVPFSLGHHKGGHLGNYADNEGLAGEAMEAKQNPRPTIDQILAWSEAFYPDLGAIRERAMVVGPDSISWNYSNPSAKSGTIQNVRGVESSLELFNRIFLPADATERGRRPVVDHVLESYKHLRNGNRRLSAADRQRLDDHMDRIGELQRKLNTGLPNSCARIVPPADDALNHQQNEPLHAVRNAQLFNEVIAAAFICGTSRIAVLGLGSDPRFVSFPGDWHNDVAHMWPTPENQQLLVTAYQRIFESVFLDMATRLDVEEEPGVTYLDNSLVVWTQESGMSTHDPLSMPIVTCGSAAGFFKTGLSLDYRRVGHPDSRFDPQANENFLYAGVTYNQFLATVLQAMGLPPAEFERWGHKGYGYPLVTPPDIGILPFARHYQNTSSRYFQIASDVLPFLRA
jgi:hypothetical protein